MIHVCHTEDSPSYQELVRIALGLDGVADAKRPPPGALFGLHQHRTLASTLAALPEFLLLPDDRVILLDLELPDSQGVETYTRVRTALLRHSASHPARRAPVIVLSGTVDGACAETIGALGGHMLSKSDVGRISDLIVGAVRGGRLVDPDRESTGQFLIYGKADAQRAVRLATRAVRAYSTPPPPPEEPAHD